MIRLPDFVAQEDVEWAVREAGRKKKMDCSACEMITVDEGLCVQMMHIGPYDSEPETVAAMDVFLEENGYENDIGVRRHHAAELPHIAVVHAQQLRFCHHPGRP